MMCIIEALHQYYKGFETPLMPYQGAPSVVLSVGIL